MHNCPYVWEADTHLWLQNKRVFAADSTSAGQDFMAFFLPCSKASRFFSVFWSVKLQYILSSLFHSQIVLSLSYLSPLPKYVSSFYLQHFNVEGGSFLGFSPYFFFQCSCGSFEGHTEVLRTTAIFEALSILRFNIILMTSGLSTISK